MMRDALHASLAALVDTYDVGEIVLGLALLARSRSDLIVARIDTEINLGKKVAALRSDDAALRAVVGKLSGENWRLQ